MDRTGGDRKEAAPRQEPRDGAGMVAIVEAVPFGPNDLEPMEAKRLHEGVEIEPDDRIPGWFPRERETGAHGRPRHGGVRRLRHGYGPPGDTCHLRERRFRPLQVVETVVDVDDVERGVRERQVLGVGDYRRQVDAVAARAFARAAGRTQRNVRADDPRTSPREQLGLHSRATTHRQHRRAGEQLLDSRNAAPELLLQHPRVQLGRARRTLDLELRILLVVEMLGLAQRVPARAVDENRDSLPAAVRDCVVLEQGLYLDHAPFNSRSFAPMMYS